jgi:hypothetical protein
MTTHELTLILDEPDHATIQAEFARRQSAPAGRDEHGVIIDQGGSNLSGALVAEIVREVIELRAVCGFD